jgi:hypothetical protein
MNTINIFFYHRFFLFFFVNIYSLILGAYEIQLVYCKISRRGPAICTIFVYDKYYI